MAVALARNAVVIGIDQNGGRIVFQKIVSLAFESDRYSPADSLSFTALDAVSDRLIVRAELALDGKKVFEGIVDVQRQTIGQNGSYHSFVCRRDTCRMLDNEVKPYWYFNLTSDQLIKTHALPYGASGASLPKSAVLPQILAKKGASHWEFITLFCRLAYHKSPYIDRNGTITCEPFQETEHCFSNHLAEGIPFTEAVLTDDRYLLLTKVWVKTGKEEYGAAYQYVLSNPPAAKLGILRERYYNPENEWKGEPSLAARQYYEDKQAGSFEIELTVPGFYDIHAGDTARFDDPRGSYNHLYVTRVRISSDASGNMTKVTLWDQYGLINQ